MKLAVISHTEHYLKPDGRIVGWGPTVRELNHLLELFEEIWHIAVLNAGPAPPSALPYTSERIHFIPIKPFGGPRIIDKFSIILQAPSVIRTLRQVLKQVDWWQFRAPTGIGVFLIPYLSLFVHKPGWFKYAGNWGQEMPAIGYRWQRFWLAKLQKRKVTINGRWPGQPRHCLSFENPCLNDQERQIGIKLIPQKDYQDKLAICFVGRLETGKGIDKLMLALDMSFAEQISTLHIIGDGPLKKFCEEQAIKLPFQVKLYGELSRERVGDIMSDCNILILPSKAEGFPKVIAEGANYGCVPVVSDISGISQYIKQGKSGFLLSPERLENGYLAKDIAEIFANPILKSIAKAGYEMAGDFTFKRYQNRIEKEIIGQE